MRRTPTKRTPDKSRSLSSTRIGLSASGSPNVNNFYFCHYKNSMYMGGIKSFKKNGRGILIHDNGVSVLSSYFNDMMHGHNIFFTHHCLLSAEYIKNKIVEAVYRTDGFLVYINYNADGQLDGRCILVTYITRSIVYANFKKNMMIDRYEETDFNLINKIFDLN